MKELQVLEPKAGELTQEMQSAVQQAMQQMAAPLLQAYAEMTQAMAQIAQTVRMTQQDIEALKHEQMRNTPLTTAQERHLTAAIHEQARNVCLNYGLESTARKAAIAAMRKRLCRRWGVDTIRGIPSCEYSVALEAVEMWDSSAFVEKYI